MEITPVTPAVRTAKVRNAKTAVPKSSSKTTEPAVAKSSATTGKRKVLSKKSAAPETAELTRMIAMAAYYLAEQRQFAPGYELPDWLTAEQQILGGPSQ